MQPVTKPLSSSTGLCTDWKEGLTLRQVQFSRFATGPHRATLVAARPSDTSGLPRYISLAVPSRTHRQKSQAERGGRHQKPQTNATSQRERFTLGSTHPHSPRVPTRRCDDGKWHCDTDPRRDRTRTGGKNWCEPVGFEPAVLGLESDLHPK